MKQYFQNELDKIINIVSMQIEISKRRTSMGHSYLEDTKNEYNAYYQKYYGEKIDLLSSIEKSIEEYQLEPPKKKITPDSVKDATITVTYTDISFVLAEIRRQYEAQKNLQNVQAEK